MLFVLAVLVAVLGLAGWLVYARTTAALQDQLRARISEDFVLMQDAHARAGEQGLAEFISWASATRSSQSSLFGMFTADGTYLSGNLTALPAFRGWGDINLTTSDQTQSTSLLGYTGQIGDHVVVLAVADNIVSATGDAVLQALIGAGIVVAIVGLSAAYLAGRSTSVRLQRLAQALKNVSAGNSSARLPLSPRNDQIDFVSHQINGYLDRLAELMDSMRNTAIAIAHDLKSPLHRVSILLQEASAAEEPDDVRRYLDKIYDEMDGLRDTLDTILRISRIESSEDTSSFAAFDLAAMLADLVQTFEPVLEEQDQTIRFVPSAGPVSPAFGDRRMLQQLVVNLIENAGRYAGSGAKIEISVIEGAGAPVVSIADNGPGIPADKRDAVFEPFFRMNPERDEMGTGLGLAMVKAIATRHRASICLQDNHPGLLVRLSLAPQGAFLVNDKTL